MCPTIHLYILFSLIYSINYLRLAARQGVNALQALPRHSVVCDRHRLAARRSYGIVIYEFEQVVQFC